jgi:microcystin-dependent protein
MTRILAALLALWLGLAPAYPATLLPPGQQTFTDANGKPLAGGSLTFYVPNTTTAKPTYKDAAQTVLNTNPIILDGAGRATVYGAGAYRQILKDASGNLIWDQLTADTSSSQIAWGGTSTGTANAQVVSATNFTSADGQIVGFLAGLGNTGQLTVNANGAGPIPVLTDSRVGPVNLTGSEISAGSAVLLVYDAGRGAFHLVGAGLSAPGFGGAQTLVASNVLDLGLAPTHNVTVTGGASITSFGSSATTSAPIYVVFFAGSSIIQASNNLSTPGGGALAVYPGDALVVSYNGGGAWSILSYQPLRGSATPSGQIGAFASQACPAGWIFADGSYLNRGGNAALFAAIGTTWGAGDNTNFQLPDLRGQFLRGIDLGAGVDPGRGFGTAQGDTVGPHSHSFGIRVATVSGTAAFQFPDATSTTQFPVTGQTPTGTTETRPKNVAVVYCVKL